MSNYTGKKVFVGLSGGVDSAVSAALLKKRGYDVTGVFIKAWGVPGQPCLWREDRRSAMRAAALLDIPFLTLDLEKEYKQQVVDYMIAEYKAGHTPNPDVMCNKQIKFGEFLKFALKQSADYVATGHYARVFTSPQTRGGRDEVRVGLKEGKDKNKDQSYFLWTLTQDQLKHILFPIGDLEKEEVRKLAKKFGLPQAERKDSQGVCFLGQVNMKEFLKEHVGAEKGKVLNEEREEIGEHDGALLYTIGERHGFKVFDKNTEREPMYVVAKDIKRNTIMVAPKITPHLSPTQGASLLYLEDINWVNDKPKGEIECRFRYRQKKIKCKIIPYEKSQGEPLVYVEFNKPQLVASGQSVVFYDNENCLGGAIIS